MTQENAGSPEFDIAGQDFEMMHLYDEVIKPALNRLDTNEIRETLQDAHDHFQAGGVRRYASVSWKVHTMYKNLKESIAGETAKAVSRGVRGSDISDLPADNKAVMQIKFDKAEGLHNQYGVGVVTRQGEQIFVTQIQLLRAISDMRESFRYLESNGIKLGLGRQEISRTELLKMKQENITLKPGIKIAAIGVAVVGASVVIGGYVHAKRK